MATIKLVKIKAENVRVGDLIYIIPENEYVRIIETWDTELNMIYNAVGKDGSLTDTCWAEDLRDYIDQWLHTWDGELEFYRNIK